MSAVFKLTREYLAQIAPGFDPDDDANDAELWRLLGASDGGAAINAWLARHPNRALVAEYWRELDADVDEMMASLTGGLSIEAPPGAWLPVVGKQRRPRRR